MKDSFYIYVVYDCMKKLTGDIYMDENSEPNCWTKPLSMTHTVRNYNI